MPRLNSDKRTARDIIPSRNCERSGSAVLSTRVPNLWIDTDYAGFIVDWHPDALSLIGYAAQNAPHLMLPLMFTSGGPVRAQIKRARSGQIIEQDGVIRPHGGAGVPVRYRIEASPTGYTSRAVVRWTFTVRDSAVSA